MLASGIFCKLLSEENLSLLSYTHHKHMPAPLRIKHKSSADTGLIQLPQLAPHFGFHAIDDRQVFLYSETANTLLHGSVYPNLLPLLDGQRRYCDIAASLAAMHSESEVKATLNALTSKGYAVSGEYSMDTAKAAFWTSLGASPRYVEERLAASSVSIVGHSDHLREQLELIGATVTDNTDNSTLFVILCDDYLDEKHAQVNQHHLATNRAWMLVRANGLKPLFGPVFRPKEHGPCWNCLAYRLRGHQEIHNFLRNLTEGTLNLAPRCVEPSAVRTFEGIAALEIAKWLVFGQHALIHNKAISLDICDLSVSHHPIQRRPQCFTCGDESLYRTDRKTTPIRLADSAKNVRNSGGVRSVSPEVTLTKYRHLIDPIGGVITWLRRTTSAADPWLHVYWAGSNIALKNRALNVLRLSLRTKSAGKGSTPQQSEASALCEALERYCGAFHGDEIRVTKRFADFASENQMNAINPNDVQLFSDTQLNDADRINASGHPYNVVPMRFNPDMQTEWSPLWSLTNDQVRYLPTSLLYYGKSTDFRGRGDFVADSNGCAAGNTLEEAILQGFFELVERDAFAVWWYNRLQVPKVDIESFGDEYLTRACEYYRRLNRDLWVLDITSDLGIPTFVAVSRRNDKQAEDIIYGAGSHFDPHIAAMRAVCELNQFLNWVQGTNYGGAGYQVDDPQCLSWWQTATVADHPYLAPDTNTQARCKSSYRLSETDSFQKDVQQCQALVESKGMEFLVLDQTRPDVRMPVVRVVVPGMRHYWERFAPGRLYNVPVQMGWRDRPLLETQLNPAPVIG